MRQITALDGSRIWVGDAWVEWRHKGVTYWRQLGAIYARDAAGRRFVLAVTNFGSFWQRQSRTEVA